MGNISLKNIKIIMKKTNLNLTIFLSISLSLKCYYSAGQHFYLFIFCVRRIIISIRVKIGEFGFTSLFVWCKIIFKKRFHYFIVLGAIENLSQCKTFLEVKENNSKLWKSFMLFKTVKNIFQKKP